MSKHSSTSGAGDISLVPTARSLDEVIAGWQPNAEMIELRAAVLMDELSEVLSWYPRFVSEEERLGIAQALVSEGAKAGIDPVFLAAVVRVESLFSTGAVSNKGARGLMQVMPATGEEIARELGIEWIGPEQLHDPAFNVRLGVTYLGWLLDKYAGNYKFALTAYNRGPRVLQFIVQRDGFLKPEFTEYFRQIRDMYLRYLEHLMTGPTSAILQVS